MDQDELIELWTKACTFSTKPNIKRYEAEHVFDENKSVKWNREEVERINKMYDEKAQELKEEKQAISAKAHDETIKYIQECLDNPSEEKAELLWSFIYREWHSCMSDCIYYISDMTELINSIDKLNKE